jgi:hypothetical protein
MFLLGGFKKISSKFIPAYTSRDRRGQVQESRRRRRHQEIGCLI